MGERSIKKEGEEAKEETNVYIDTDTTLKGVRQILSQYRSRLAPEPRLIAFNFVSVPKRYEGSCKKDRNSKKRSPSWGLSSRAAVCREWQVFFERITFQQLILYQADIRDFHKIVQGRRRPLLEWVWLRLELSEYDCERCDRRVSTYEKKTNNITFTDALWDLFKTLSEWNNKKGNEVSPKGLTMEPSAHSPSDPKHFAEELGFRINDTAWSSEMVFQGKRQLDLARGWSRKFGRKTGMADNAKLRLLEATEVSAWT
ncbi:hypothetical protein DL770_006826 [Monosporascus sp. CRB-9-2]|nr:hypothetical protein DL770_006826 [Monosporascus sp. CRB-9-2]